MPAVTYSVRASEFLTSFPGTNVFINPTLLITSSNICLTWPSVAGRQYYVEGKVGVADPSWTVLSPTNTAAGTTMSFCIDRPTPYRFFQVVEVGAVPPPAAPSTTNVFINPTLTITSSNIALPGRLCGTAILRRGQSRYRRSKLDRLVSDQHRGGHNDEFLH
jgi:hypothetical protein